MNKFEKYLATREISHRMSVPEGFMMIRNMTTGEIFPAIEASNHVVWIGYANGWALDGPPRHGSPEVSRAAEYYPNARGWYIILGEPAEDIGVIFERVYE